MKTIRLLKARIKFMLILLMFTISYSANAQRGQYHTLRDGDFLETNTWGFNSTNIECGCYPDDDGACIVNVPANKLVNIYHDITTNCGIYIGANSDIVVHAGGSLTLLGSASMIGDGYLLIEEGATVSVGGNVNLTGNSTVWNNGLFVVGGNLNIDGSGLLCGTGTLVVDGEITGEYCNSMVLPVTLLYFSGEINENKINLYWETASESNNDYFDIEKSSDGRNYTLLMRVESKADKGTSNSNLNYFAIDEDPIKGISYYRLKQTDLDKKSRYSSIISIDYLNKKSDVSFFPNPNNGELFVNYINLENKDALLTIKNALNNIVFSGTINADASKGNKIFSMPEEIPSGIYFCTLTVNDKTYSQKIILLPR